MTFTYRDHGGTNSAREVEPHRIVHLDRRWYLVAWDTAKRAFRTFRVDRITPPIADRAHFTPRDAPGGDLTAYVTRAVSSGPYAHAREGRSTSCAARGDAAADRPERRSARGDGCAHVPPDLRDELVRLDRGVARGARGRLRGRGRPVALATHVRTLAERFARAEPQGDCGVVAPFLVFVSHFADSFALRPSPPSSFLRSPSRAAATTASLRFRSPTPERTARATARRATRATAARRTAPRTPRRPTAAATPRPTPRTVASTGGPDPMESLDSGSDASAGGEPGRTQVDAAPDAGIPTPRPTRRATAPRMRATGPRTPRVRIEQGNARQAPQPSQATDAGRA